jgi:hypothetical protein
MDVPSGAETSRAPQRRQYFKRLPLRNSPAGTPLSSPEKPPAAQQSNEQRRQNCVAAALEREALREREAREHRALAALSHLSYYALVNDQPSASPASWAVRRGLVATAAQLSQRRLSFARVLLPSPGAASSALDLLPRDLLEMVFHELQLLPHGRPELYCSEADQGCTISDGGALVTVTAVDTGVETLREAVRIDGRPYTAAVPTRRPPRDILTVDRFGCQDSPPHAELVRTALCAESRVATGGLCSVALTVERNDNASKVMLGFVDTACEGAFAPVFCGRPPQSGGRPGDRIELRLNADGGFVELKLNDVLLGRMACSMPFYAAGFGSLCFAVGADNEGCTLRIESTDPALFDPEGDARERARAAFARDHAIRFSSEASSYYDVTGEDGTLARTLRVVDHGRLAPCDGVMRADSGEHSALFEVVHQPAGYGLHIGVARAEADVWRDALGDGNFWGLVCNSGRLVNGRYASRWAGQERFREGDQIELLLDSSAGTLHVKKNGRLLGAAVSARGVLPVWEELVWAVVGGEGDAIRVHATDPTQFFI